MAKKYYKEDDEDIPAIKYADAEPSGYTLIEGAAELLKLTKDTYRQRRSDGLEYVNTCLSIWRTKIMDSTYTEQQVADLEVYLSLMLGQVQCGAWKTGKDVLSGLALSGIFDQDMKDDIGDQLDIYITENY